MLHKLKQFWNNLFAERADFAHTVDNSEPATLLLVDSSGEIIYITTTASKLLGTQIVGRQIVDLLSPETQQQITHELMTAGLAPEKFSIEEIAHHSILNGEDRQNWLLRAWPNVPVAVHARIVPVYSERELTGYQIHLH